MRQLFPACDDHADIGAIYRPPSSERGLWRTNMVATVNGAVEFGGVSRPISSSADRQVFRVIRTYADAVVIGRGNALAEGYAALPRPMAPEVAMGGRDTAPRLVVVARSLDGLAAAPLAASTEQVIIATSRSKEEEAEALARSFEVEPAFVFIGDEELEARQLRAALDGLGLRNVVCEGGPTLLGILLANQAIDEICLTVTPMVAPSHHGGPFGPGGNFGLFRLELASLLEEEGTLLYRYRLVADEH